MSQLAATLRDGSGDRSDLPPWLVEAERQYNLAQALPNRSAAELEEMTADELDAILSVYEVYQGVFYRNPNRHTHEE